MNRDLNREALEQERDELEFSIVQIKNQLQAAKSLAAAEDVYADRDWFVRASAALRIKGQQHQAVLRELGALMKTLRRDRNDSRERRFVQVAKRVLATETYAALWVEVDDAADDSEQSPERVR